mgnify:CR=1 FL=1
MAGLEQAPGRETLGDFLRGEALAFFPEREHFGVAGGFGKTHPFDEAGEWRGGIHDGEELRVLDVGLRSQAGLSEGEAAALEPLQKRLAEVKQQLGQ